MQRISTVFHIALFAVLICGCKEKLHAHKNQAHKVHKVHKAHKRHVHKAHKGHTHKHAKHTLPAAHKKRVHKRSLYILNAQWTRQNGKKVAFASFKGKIQIVSMVYASCPHACPVTISDLKAIEHGIAPKDRKKVGFILITFDPKRDTVQKLNALAQKRKLDPKRWSLLRGPTDQVLELAALLGVKYKKVSATDYAHSNIISILSPQGVIKHQQIGLSQDPKASLKVIQKLLQKVGSKNRKK